MVKMMPDPVRLRHDHRVRLGNHRRGLAAPHEDVYARQCRPPPQRRREQRQIGRRLRGHPCLTIRRSFRCTETVLFGAHLLGLRRHAMRDVARSLDRAGTRDAAAGEHRPILGRRRHRSVFTQPGTSNPTTPGARVGRRGDVCTVFLRADGMHEDLSLHERAASLTPTESSACPVACAMRPETTRFAPSMANQPSSARKRPTRTAKKAHEILRTSPSPRYGTRSHCESR